MIGSSSTSTICALAAGSTCIVGPSRSREKHFHDRSIVIILFNENAPIQAFGQHSYRPRPQARTNFRDARNCRVKQLRLHSFRYTAPIVLYSNQDTFLNALSFKSHLSSLRRCLTGI